MVFSSVIFLFFFLPLFLLVYFTIRKELRNLCLLVASLLFYFWGEGRYVIVMVLYMFFNWLFGRLIEKYKINPTPRRKNIARVTFVLAIIFNLGFLIFYKYFNFIVDNLNQLISFTGKSMYVPAIHLPIGISFFTFQALSYIIDVYRGDVKAQRNLIDFSMYKALFPQLIAGPIVRYRDVASQMHNRKVTYKHFAEGVERFMVGLSKKVLIANNVAVIADRAFQQGSNLTAETAWIGIVCYALQIYFDFSGYSDMAIGLGKMLGFDFLENFNYPYIARSIKDFWRRWHISLSSWFRDYVYIALGGNRAGKYRTYLNLFGVFFLCGLWHGASWNYVVWGAWHGAFLVLERTSFGRLLSKANLWVQYLYTLIVVLMGWAFFRANTMNEALVYLKAMAGVHGFNPKIVLAMLHPKLMLALAVGIVFSMPVYTKLRNGRFSIPGLPVRPVLVLYPLLFTVALFVAFILCTIILSTDTYNPFIYFRF
jgi:alginate O-acetyltransferase complex protein AlgI